jgi:hypothetical protein
MCIDSDRVEYIISLTSHDLGRTTSIGEDRVRFNSLADKLKAKLKLLLTCEKALLDPTQEDIVPLM